MIVNLTINGQPVSVPKGTKIIDAAKKINIRIPTLCEHPDLCKRSVCRICVVECDGNSKLIPACANDVWEGMDIVTDGLRLFEVRKTILELLLANHPRNCLFCIRNKNCELQMLAENFGIRSVTFTQRCVESCSPVIESNTLVREPDKCIKCGRCTEVCQNFQAICSINSAYRSVDYKLTTPYKQALHESACVFCGQCEAVCPVGAIYEYDQSGEVQNALSSGKYFAVAQFSAITANELFSVMKKKSCLSPGAITTGKIVSALKMIGFDKVFDTGIFTNESRAKINSELQMRIKTNEKLPVISGCSQGVYRFINHFFPDLIDHLSPVYNSPRHIFIDMIKTVFAAAKPSSDGKEIMTVSFAPCIAQKYGSDNKADFTLTVNELARMIKLAGIEITNLPEESFSKMEYDSVEIPEPAVVQSYSEAFKMMEAIRKGECSLQWVKIKGCLNRKCT